MKRKTRLFCSLILTLLLVSFTPTVEDWQLLETGRYKIYFPGKPSEETRSIDSDIGKLPIVANIFKADNSTDENIQYGIFEIIYPENSENFVSKELVDTLYNRFVNGIAGQLNGNLVSEKNISKGEYPGRQVKVGINNGQLEITANIYLVKNILYMLQVMTSSAKKSNGSIERFMNSFTLKKLETVSD